MCSSATSAINTLERVLRHQGRRRNQPLVVIPLVSTRMSAAAPGKTKRIVTTATHNGSIAVAGAQVSSTPSVSRVVFLSHTSRCGGRGRGGARSAVRRGVRRVSEWAKALGREVCSPASWRCVPRRVSAWARALRPEALSTPGGLGRYWAAQWHLARAVGKRFRGCRAKRLYVHMAQTHKPTYVQYRGLYTALL